MDIAFSLEETLKESIRVRNLLARTPDDSFHRILHSVLRDCIRRLDETSVALYSATSGIDVARRVTRQQIQGHTIGSLAHATQRLRGGTAGDATWLLEASQELTQLQSSITRTVLIALLETGARRTSVVSPCFPYLFSFLDALYRNILEDKKATTEAAQKQLTSTSWVVLDLLAHHAGMSFLQDWERESYAGIDCPPWNLTMESATEDVALAVTQDGTGTLDLFMDIILFWPASKHIPGQEDNSTGLSIEGLARMNYRCKEGSVWDEIYLRHLKYACTKYAIGVSVRKPDGLFRRQSDRAMLLAVLGAATNSMHGRLAYAFVTESIGPHAFDEARIAPTGISWSLAINLLMLILGDEATLAITEKYPGAKHVFELLGPRPASPRYRREPLPTDVSNRIVRFLRINIDVKCALDSLDKGDTDATAVALYLDLAVKTQDPTRPSIFWGIDLLVPFFRQVCRNNLLSEDLRKMLCSKLLATAVSALETVAPSKTPLVEEPHARDHELPLGVPADFSDRDDLNGLLHKHRTLQRKRALLSYEAMEARNGAYQMITDCFRLAGVPEEDPLSVPIAMFQCIASEDRGLSPSVADALKVIMINFKDARFNDMMCQGQTKIDFIAPLLPSLICAAASDSDDSRDVAAEWTNNILVDFDEKIAGLMSNYLSERVNSTPTTESNSERQRDCLTRFFNLDLSSSINEALCVILGRMKVFGDSVATSPELSLALLQKFDFSVEAARNAFKNDKLNAIREVGMACRAGIEPAILQPGTTCRICFNDFSSSFALSCGHRFCTTCWKDYLNAKVSEDGKKSLSITCPDHKCDEVMSIFEVERMDALTAKRMCKDLVSAFVERDPLYAACPKVGCPMVAWRKSHQKQVAVTCERCDQEFCFDCGSLPHRPAACKVFTRWNRIFGSSSFWIRKNAKPCPSCAAPIEKSSGCNHIRCQQCGADWCWICLRYLRSHMEAHVCNRYNVITNAEAEEEQRSIFFTDRYQAHEEAEAVAKQRADFIQSLEKEIKEGLWYANESEIGLYVAAFGLLVEARSFLKYSYVAAWSQHADVAKHFQHQQAILEVATEKLTQLTISRLDDIYTYKGYPGMQFVFRSIDFHSSIVRECICRLNAMKQSSV